MLLVSKSSRLAMGPIQSPVQRRPGVKQLGCETEHSPESSAEGINGALSVLPPFAFMGYTGTTLYLFFVCHYGFLTNIVWAKLLSQYSD